LRSFVVDLNEVRGCATGSVRARSTRYLHKRPWIIYWIKNTYKTGNNKLWDTSFVSRIPAMIRTCYLHL